MKCSIHLLASSPQAITVPGSAQCTVCPAASLRPHAGRALSAVPEGARADSPCSRAFGFLPSLLIRVKSFCGTKLAFVSGEVVIILVAEMSAPRTTGRAVLLMALWPAWSLLQCPIPQWFTGLSWIEEKSPPRPIGTSESGVAGLETDWGKQRHF